MAEDTILTWNVPNWITVILMAGTGLAIVGFGVRLYKKKKGASGGASGTAPASTAGGAGY